MAFSDSKPPDRSNWSAEIDYGLNWKRMKCAIQLKLEKLDPSLWPHFSRIATFWDLTVNDLRLLGLRDALIGHWISIVGIIYNVYANGVRVP